jgi:hypothetical protein
VAVDSTVQELEARTNAARQYRRPFEGQMLLNLAFYLGQQWVGFDGRTLFQLGGGDGRVMLTSNRIRGAVRSDIAKMTKTQPQWVGVPRNSSDDEIVRARLREIVFEHYWRELKARRKLRMALLYQRVCGDGYWKLCWDKQAGDSMTVLAHKGGPVVTDGYGRPMAPQRLGDVPPELADSLEQRQVTFGEPRLEVRSPFEILADPLATEEGVESCEYMGEEAIYSPAYLARCFGKEGLSEDAQPGVGVMEGRFPGITNFLTAGRTSRGAAGRRGVKVCEYWSRPGVDDPKGRHVVWTKGGELLLEEAIPYPFLPYVKFAGMPAGRFISDAPVTDLVSPQTEYNKTVSQIAENAERFGNPVRARSVESNVSEWQGLPGEEIVYHAYTGGASDLPQFLPPPEMPGYVQAQTERQLDDFRTISGQFEVSQGSVPEGVTAAAAISQLQEANDTQIGPDIAELSDALVDAGKMVMWMLTAYASNGRIAQIAGPDATWDIYTFKGDELGNASADEVDIGSGLTDSKAAKQAAIHEMLNLFIQNGQAPPPRELRRITRDFQVGGLDHFFAGISRDINQINDEHRRMLQGEQLPINEYDNHQLHVEEHEDFQKSARYQLLVKGSPQEQMVAQSVAMHVAAHKQLLQQQATQQAQVQMAMQASAAGQPPPPSPNGGPPPGAPTDQPPDPGLLSDTGSPSPAPGG